MPRGIGGSLFSERSHVGVRAVMTGQVGVDKKPFVERVAAIARTHGRDVAVCHVGDMMYAEAPDVVPGRILDLPRSRLDALRRSVFKDILRIAEKCENVLVNTHVTFRWRHGLFPAFDHDQMIDFDADLYFTLVDNVDSVHERLSREHVLPHTLKDILVWREEEILGTELLSRLTRGHGSPHVILRGTDGDTAGSVVIRGGSAIVNPLGQVLVGPVFGGETILTADLDLGDVARGKMDFDVVGHYARPDVFQLSVNERPASAVTTRRSE